MTTLQTNKLSVHCIPQRETAVEYYTPSPRDEKIISDCVQSKRDMKNFESIQQAFLLGLLTQFGSFTIERPIKKAKVTFQILKVQSFSLPTETINIAEWVELFCKQRSELELQSGVKQERVKRRYDKNRFIFLSNYLLDVASEFGFFFDTKMSRNTGGAIQLEKIRNVYWQNKLLFRQQEMMIKGIALNKYLFSLADNSEKVGKLEMNDPIVSKILYDPVEVVQKEWDVCLQQRTTGRRRESSDNSDKV